MKVGEVWRGRGGPGWLVLYVHHDGQVLMAPLDHIEDTSWDRVERITALWTFVRYAGLNEGRCNACGPLETMMPT